MAHHIVESVSELSALMKVSATNSERDAGFCSGGDEDDISDLHSPSSSEDSLELRKGQISAFSPYYRTHRHHLPLFQIELTITTIIVIVSIIIVIIIINIIVTTMMIRRITTTFEKTIWIRGMLQRMASHVR
ncbi:hypothetical protein HZU73_02667 [Apis mellifera caucasica]|nr:hypothetical protein HZU73_02667 [Apis mellifera caucasica]KAG9433443.1 hypothetical protein HZU67_05412 [Apis mellifera carnica]